MSQMDQGNDDDFHLTPEQVNKCININHLYSLRYNTISHYYQLYQSVYALMLWTTVSHYYQLYPSVHELMLWPTRSRSKFRNTINTNV